MRFQLSLAVRYLLGRKLRSFLTTLAIVVGVIVIFSMGSLLPTIMETFQRGVVSLSGQVDVTVAHRTGEAFSDNQLAKVERIPGVEAAAASISRQINVPVNFYGEGVNIPSLMLVGVDPVAGTELRDYALTEGRFLKRGDGNVTVITSSLADALGLKLGDTLRMLTTEGLVKLTIVGIRPGRPTFGSEEVLITLPQAQKLLDMAGRVNVVEANLNTRDAAEREAIIAQIQTELGRYYTINALASNSQILGSLAVAQGAFNLLGFLTLFMGGFIIYNTFRTIVAERRHDIGMLRAIGASRNTIIGLILTEGLVQGVAGTGIGLALGYLLGRGFNVAIGSVYRQFLNMEPGPLIVPPAVIVTSVVLGIGITLLAGLLPALNAGRVTPLEVLRPQASAATQRISRGPTIAGAIMLGAALIGLFSGQFALVAVGGLLFLFGLVLVAPALVKPMANVLSAAIKLIMTRDGMGDLARGNTTRQSTRSATTASTTMIGLAIVVGAGGLMWSLNDSLIGMFRKTMGSDYMLVPPSVSLWSGDVGATTSLANKIRSVPGVGTVSTLRYAKSELPSKIDGGDIQLSVLGVDPATYQEVSGMDFTQGDPQDAYPALASERALIVNGILAVQAGLNAGDTVALSTPQGQKDYRIVAVAGDVLNMKVNTAYISHNNLRADFNKTEDIFLQINLAQGADAAAVDERLQTVTENYPQFRFVATRQYLGEFSQQFDTLCIGVYGLLAMLSMLSLVAILNTLAIGVIERTREIGVLRAIGAARSQVRRMIVAEALLLAAIGTAFGLLGGLYLSYVLVQGLSASGIFKMQYTFPLASVLAATAAGLLFGVLAALFPARQAARMEIIRALRYE